MAALFSFNTVLSDGDVTTAFLFFGLAFAGHAFFTFLLPAFLCPMFQACLLQVGYKLNIAYLRNNSKSLCLLPRHF